MMGDSLEKKPSVGQAAPAPGCAISVSNLTKAFGTRKAVDRVSFDLPQGAFLSVFGPNGAGKTTLLRMLSTLTRPTDGSIVIDGVDALEEPDVAREHIGLISHNAMLYPDLTAEENLLFYARLYGVREPEKRVIELLDAVGLKHRRLDLVRTFSRGMTQRVAIARALTYRPSFILMDEPFAALDYFTRTQMQKELLRLQRESGVSILFVTHSIDEALLLGHKIIVIENGLIQKEFTIEENGGERNLLEPAFIERKKEIIEQLHL